jgi:hypothetical protein
MGRGRTVVVAIVVALAVAAYGAWWLQAAARLHQGIDAWVEANRARGWHIELDNVAVRGFPLQLRVEADRFTVGRDVPFAWRWSGPLFTASAPPWIGRDIALSFPGAHKIEFDARDGHKVIPVSAAQARGRVRIGNDGRIASFSLALGDIAAELPDLGPTRIAKLDASLAVGGKPTPAPNSPRAPEVGRLMLSAQSIDLPPRAATTLGQQIGEVDLEAALLGAVPAAQSETALAAWRDAGGTVEMEKLRLHWGAFQLEANGTTALDARLQPEGALTARIWGASAAIDALVDGGSVRPREGATAKVVLHTMAKPSTAQGVSREVEVPLSVQDRKLYLGPVVIARVPTVVWP